jgi:hypothetical protein
MEILQWRASALRVPVPFNGEGVALVGDLSRPGRLSICNNILVRRELRNRKRVSRFS